MATKELVLIFQVLRDLRVSFSPPAYLYCDHTVALHIASNSVFLERTKHIDISCHKVHEAIEDGLLKTMYVQIGNQVPDGLTKALHPTQFRTLLGNMDVHNIFAHSS